ncbi:MAG TPA: hypothetical protein TECP_01015 [Hyphomicrobiaceae bacterium MAG_BT-2024]
MAICSKTLVEFSLNHLPHTPTKLAILHITIYLFKINTTPCYFRFVIVDISIGMIALKGTNKMTDNHQIRVEIAGTINSIPAELWDACANPTENNYDPFVSHAFLKALEDSETIRPQTGWQPTHLILKTPGCEIEGCMPLYVKSHSRGEYVFDHSWADAFKRIGGIYYPKLLSAVPFTPVTGRRLLIRPGKNYIEREKHLIDGAIELTHSYNLSSLHINFLSEQEWIRTGEAKLLKRTDQQFHWLNQNYTSFEDFLSGLVSRKRKAIRKERLQAIQRGISIEWLNGTDIKESHWDSLYLFYLDTSKKKWGHPYLNRKFFSLLGATLSEKCLLIMVSKDGRYIAGALNMIGGNCLYGRYWGSIEHFPCLHYEVCYYQAIDFAIRHKLKRIEAGAQGEHKLSRGYLPTPTYSSHYILNPYFRQAVASFLSNELTYVKHSRNALLKLGPYRNISY